MGNFRKLVVWQHAHRLTLSVYRATVRFPKDEVYGLTSQMRRASVSIGANIAEGCGRNGDREMQRYLRIALGSANEVEYHAVLAEDLEYLPRLASVQLQRDIAIVKRMLAKLVTRLDR
jgi:four helix bundle protein